MLTAHLQATAAMQGAGDCVTYCPGHREEQGGRASRAWAHPLVDGVDEHILVGHGLPHGLGNASQGAHPLLDVVQRLVLALEGQVLLLQEPSQ